MSTPDYKTTHPKTREAWRQWLQRNHGKSPGVWLIYFKKETGKRRFTYAEAVEEALCFGWIDSAPRKLDEARSMLKFTPRKANSIWSELNKQRVKKLIANGQMTGAGMAKIRQAKSNGSWDRLTNSDRHVKNNTVPPDLAAALKKNKKALAHFNAFAPGYRKQFLAWIDSARRAETRKARINQTVLMSAANKKPGATGFKL